MVTYALTSALAVFQVFLKVYVFCDHLALQIRLKSLRDSLNLLSETETQASIGSLISCYAVLRNLVQKHRPEWLKSNDQVPSFAEIRAQIALSREDIKRQMIETQSSSLPETVKACIMQSLEDELSVLLNLLEE